MSDDKTPVLLVGESWVTSATHYKGWDQFGSVTFHLGAEPFVAALADSPFAVTYMPPTRRPSSSRLPWPNCSATRW